MGDESTSRMGVSVTSNERPYTSITLIENNKINVYEVDGIDFITTDFTDRSHFNEAVIQVIFRVSGKHSL